MRLPNFLVVGAPKAGTSSMNRYLSEHPQIYMPSKKGLHYFTYDFLCQRTNGPGDKEILQRFCTSLNDYQKYYEQVPPQAIAIGDASPSYLFFTGCIPKIKKDLGENVKILIMVRNPIQRAFSMYYHLLNAKRESLGFFEALQAEDERSQMGWSDAWLYKGHSLYYEKVKTYMNAFGSANVKVIVHDDFTQDTARIMHEVYRFLGVDPTFVPPNIRIAYGRTGTSTSRLATFLAKPHRVKTSLRQVLPTGLLRILRYFKDSYIQRKKTKSFHPDERSVSLLRQYFRNDIEQLELHFHLKVKSWN